MERINKTKTCLSIKGEHATYQVTISFLEEYSVVQFIATFDLTFQKEDSQLLKDAVLYINNKLLIGHFDFNDESEAPVVTFTFTQPFAKELGLEMSFLSKILDLIVNTQNTFYPCFQAIMTKELTDINNIELFTLEPLCQA